MLPAAQDAPIGKIVRDCGIKRALTKVARPALAASNPAISGMLVTMAAVPPKLTLVGLIISSQSRPPRQSSILNSAVSDPVNAIESFHHAHVVGHNDHGGPGLTTELTEEPHYDLAAFSVQGSRGLVGK
jgi:hypothetical protein